MNKMLAYKLWLINSTNVENPMNDTGVQQTGVANALTPPQIEPPKSLVQWAYNNGKIQAVGETFPKLKAGIYVIERTPEHLLLLPHKFQTDSLIAFPDSLSIRIMKEIEEFWTRDDLFKSFGFLHRRGYLLYGPAGSGKSSIIAQISQDIVERDGIVLICNTSPSAVNEMLRQLRLVEPERNIVCLFEDIDAMIDEYDESMILSMLDGENQINHVLNVATTNYPEKLDKRIVSRPRRFDRVVKIEHPTKEMRKVYLQQKLKITNGETEHWVNSTDGFSFASLAELVISVKCLGNDFDETIIHLKDLAKKRSSSEFGDGEKIGFNQG